MLEKFNTIIVGGGQAGLAMSYHLQQHGLDHIILEQTAQPAHVWRNERWDSFTLVTPNWTFHLPGAEYSGDDPDGFIPKAEIVAAFDAYIARYQMPVRYHTQVSAVETHPGGDGYRVMTNGSVMQAKNVVIATGLYQRPRIPAFAADLPTGVTQLHSGAYRNPGALPPGAVLVVGSGQSGCQITDELIQHRRKVYLCVGSVGRVPRRYRGKDVYQWLYLSGFFDRTPDKLPSPQARFAGVPQLSGRDGGRTLNLHQFAREGVTLLGRLQGVRDGVLAIAPDLKENLAKVDGFEAEVARMIDRFIAEQGISAPAQSLVQLRDGYAAQIITSLDLEAAGVSTIIWACGYSFDFSLVKLPVLDSAGFPIQTDGVTEFPGLYFVGLPWLSRQKTGLLMGVGEHTGQIAEAIAARDRW
ncbi:MAG: NAD(P)-binding domain-containing protein [Chloroflexi bacterium]|nr:NAD(P)-binding domain-containing protein [Chloroflexota bacterium]